MRKKEFPFLFNNYLLYKFDQNHNDFKQLLIELDKFNPNNKATNVLSIKENIIQQLIVINSQTQLFELMLYLKEKDIEQVAPKRVKKYEEYFESAKLKATIMRSVKAKIGFWIPEDKKQEVKVEDQPADAFVQAMSYFYGHGVPQSF